MEIIETLKQEIKECEKYLKEGGFTFNEVINWDDDDNNASFEAGAISGYKRAIKEIAKLKGVIIDMHWFNQITTRIDVELKDRTKLCGSIHSKGVVPE